MRCLAGIGAAALAVAILLSSTACSGKTSSRSGKAGQGASGVGIAGTYVMNISKSEMETAHLENWGHTRLVLGKKRFRITDRRAPDQRPLVQGYSSGWTSGTYSIRGDRLTFFIGNGSGDTPLGKSPDTPIVVRWSLYRNGLTFQQGKQNEGGAGLWLKPWQRVK
jgi:hypothetical protein